MSGTRVVFEPVHDRLVRRLRGHVDRRRRARRVRRLYGRWVGRDSLCFDVGANVGERTRVMLSLGARVVAVEPQPSCLSDLRRIGSSRLVVEPVALGDAPGRTTLHVADVSTISSTSEGWIERVRASGRFSAYEWPESVEVDVSTLDELVAKYGRPDFCKIDVEGSEAQVVAGLSRPLPLLSFEFTPEWHEATAAVVGRLETLGFDRFNVSLHESLVLGWSEWRDGDGLLEHLAGLGKDPRLFGDVYAMTRALAQP